MLLNGSLSNPFCDIRKFRANVEENKHSILSLIGSSLTMVAIIPIPWALRRISKRIHDDRLESCLEKLVLCMTISMHDKVKSQLPQQ